VAKRAHPEDECAQRKLVEGVFDNIVWTTDARGAVAGGGEPGAAGADLVIEAIVEDIKVKQALFRELDAVAPPRCIFATNTSSLSVREIASATSEERRRR
jgi:3-hydroxyacyl-CoA dehydrogenase